MYIFFLAFSLVYSGGLFAVVSSSLSCIYLVFFHAWVFGIPQCLLQLEFAVDIWQCSPLLLPGNVH